MADGSEELFELGRELRAAAALAPDRVHDIVKKGANNIKKDWQDNAKRNTPRGHVRNYHYTVGYDVTKTKYGASAVIGPDKEKTVGGGPYRTPGNLGAILEFGSVNNPPHNDGGRALRAEAPRFYGAIAKAEGGFLR